MEEQQGGLLLVMAHPDDESMGSGGLVLRHTRAGIAAHLICATYGEAGWSGKPLGARKEDLPEIRAKELEEAAAALALSGVELWDYPDGGVDRSDHPEITLRISEQIARLPPRAVGERRRRHRAGRRRGDDEAARHRLPPEPARGLADRLARIPAPHAEG